MQKSWFGSRRRTGVRQRGKTRLKNTHKNEIWEFYLENFYTKPLSLSFFDRKSWFLYYFIFVCFCYALNETVPPFIICFFIKCWQKSNNVVKYTCHTNCIYVVQQWENTFRKKCFLSLLIPLLGAFVWQLMWGITFFRCVPSQGAPFYVRWKILRRIFNSGITPLISYQFGEQR